MTFPGELTDTQEQPEEPATQSVQPKAVDSEYAGTSSDENPAPLSNPQPAASLGADTAGDVPPPSSPATLSEADVPAFFREKKDCLQLKDGHCRISFNTSALCADCNAERMKKIGASA